MFRSARHLGPAIAGLLLMLTPVAARSDSSAQVADLYRASYREEAGGKAAKALDLMKQIHSSRGASYFTWARRGWLAYLAGRFAESEQAYAEAAKLKPDAIEPRLGLTLPLLAQKKWRPLEKACREVLKLDPQNAVARARLAHAYYSIGNYPDSATLYRKLVKDYPADLDNQTGLGWALARMGRGAEAKKVFAAVLEVSPDNVNARQGIALP
ncbi:MAG: tetratricopeptide repeat protein [Polyangiaceae bacterium]